MRRLCSILMLTAVAAGSWAQTAALDPARTIATVNGEEIKAAEYYRRIEWFEPDPQSNLVSRPVGFQLLRQMISERMILQLAKSKGVAPTGPEIDARIAELYRDNPNLKTQLADAGRSEADLRSELTTQEAQFKLLTAGITITDLEVEKHYKDNPSEFRSPTRYKLRIVAVGDDVTEKKVDDDIKAGKPFADIAKAYSLDVVTKNAGGVYGEVPDTALADATRKAIEITPVGSTTTWIKGAGSEARVKFFVEGVTPATTVPLDAALKSRLRRRLMLDRGTVKNQTSVGKDLEAATRTATVTISQPLFQKMYSDLLSRARQAQP